VFTLGEFQEFQKQNQLFDSAVANLQDDMVYAVGDSNMELAGNYVTPGCFEFYGVAPFLGRWLEPADYQPGAAPVFVMRYATWFEKFGADSALLGKPFSLNGVSRTLVGIAAPRFVWGGADLWMPRGPEDPKVIRNERQFWGIVARIKSNVSLQEAGANLTVIAQQL